MSRTPSTEVDAIFPDRWSPRAFDPAPLSADQIAALFEAARWAPSCFNEQPWLFVYVAAPDDQSTIQSLLVAGNRVWADRAPLLAILFAKRSFTHNDKPNRHGGFDAGAAWMALALQARRLGLYTHAMAGFDAEASYTALGVPRENWEAMAAIAVGRRADATTLPEPLSGQEAPSDRRPRSAIAMARRFDSSQR